MKYPLKLKKIRLPRSKKKKTHLVRVQENALPDPHQRAKLHILAGGAVSMLAATALHSASASADTSAAGSMADGERSLTDYGPIDTAKNAQAALDKGIADIVAKGGGILVIPPTAPSNWEVMNNAPSSTKADSATVTLIDRRDGYENILLPSNGKQFGLTWAGRHLERDVNRNIDMAFGVHSTQAIQTNIAGGTTSYAEPILFEVKQGKDQKVYVTTIRGLYTGMFVNLSGAPRSFGGQTNDSGPIKSLGWDSQKRLPYITLDLEHDHPQDALINNKHVVNSLTVTDNSNSDNQSMGLLVSRNLYGQGDSFGVSSSLRVQGNVMSAAGDEGGLAYGADIYSDINPFRSTVESIDWYKQELVYAPGAVRNYTLGTSRPLINLNRKKWITAGNVYIVAQGFSDPWDPSNKEKTGKDFQGEVLPGGAILGSKDCGWTQDVVGRFFAVDEPSEYLDPANDPGAGYAAAPETRVYRWYLIQKVENRADGTKRLFVERTRWFSNYNQAPKLYDFENYSWTGHERHLKYIIAPGAYVSDISRAWTDSEDSGGLVSADLPRTLKLAPNGDIGTSFDFEKNDPITQAIGQDPWNPTGLRVRHHNYVPSTIEYSSFQGTNQGRVAVDSGVALGGGDGNLENDLKQAKDKLPRFIKGIELFTTTRTGVHFRADVQDCAILFEQPNKRSQPIWWRVKGLVSHTLTVDAEKGGFNFQGGNIRTSGLKVHNGGISASDTEANNLRGIALPVPTGKNQLKVTFDKPETDANYAIIVQPTWITLIAVTEKTQTGFTVEFGSEAPAKAALDWVLLR
jgi:hypothetical protein